MSTRAYFVERFAAEKPVFVRVIRAAPADRLDYRPHPRSTSAAGIIGLLASELGDACELIDRGEVAWKPGESPASLEEMAAAYERNAAELEKRLPALDEAAWEKPARFLVEGNVAWAAPLGEMLWGFLFDAIHHRGQLSAYLRPMGAKVPSIYGPSGDDPGQ